MEQDTDNVIPIIDSYSNEIQQQFNKELDKTKWISDTIFGTQPTDQDKRFLTEKSIWDAMMEDMINHVLQRVQRMMDVMKGLEHSITTILKN